MSVARRINKYEISFKLLRSTNMSVNHTCSIEYNIKCSPMNGINIFAPPGKWWKIWKLKAFPGVTADDDKVIFRRNSHSVAQLGVQYFQTIAYYKLLSLNIKNKFFEIHNDSVSAIYDTLLYLLSDLFISTDSAFISPNV